MSAGQQRSLDPQNLVRIIAGAATGVIACTVIIVVVAIILLKRRYFVRVSFFGMHLYVG